MDKRWTNESIEKCIRKVMDEYEIDCMPTQIQIRKSKYGYALNNAINRSIGYVGWSEKMNLPMKNTRFSFGYDYEKHVASIIESLGYKVDHMPNNYPFDLLVNKRTKIDTKAAMPNFLTGSRTHQFGINKRISACDIYVMCAIDELEKIEKIFIVPSNQINCVTVTVGRKSIYDKYIDRWDYIKLYDNFYSNVV